MKKLLLTGFETFLDHPSNPTEELVKRLDGKQVGDYHIIGSVLPVIFDQAGKRIIAMIKEHQPDAIISLGLSAGRHQITPERVAINCIDGPQDNAGNKYQDQKIDEQGADAYFSTLPIREMVNRMRDVQLPANVSNSAGTYVCNYTMYTVLHFLKQQQLELPAGFIHVPAHHELALVQPKYPSVSLADLEKGIVSCIHCI